MAGFVKEIGNQVSRGVQGVSNSMNPPNYLYWSVIPFIIAFFVSSLLIGPFIYSYFTTVTHCESDGTRSKNCKEVKVSGYVRILIILIVAIIISSVVSAASYQTGLYIKNPKLAMGIETTRVVKNVFS